MINYRDAIYRLIILLGFGVFSDFVSADPIVYYLPDCLILRVQKNITLQTTEGRVVTNNASLQNVLDELGAFACEEFFPWDRAGTRLSRIYSISLAESTDVLTAVDVLSSLECVDFVQPDYEIGDKNVIPSDCSFRKQWGLEKIEISSAWDYYLGDENLIIAVLDNGVDYKHQDLAKTMWINTDEIPGNGVDDDGNGYIDDVFGWDFSEYSYAKKNEETGEVEYYRKIADNDPGDDGKDPYTFDSHGTHVAGIIGATADNSVSGKDNVAGVLQHCRIMAVQAGNGYGDLADSWIIKGLRYAVDNGANVINMSFGGGTEGGLVDSAVQYAHSRGIILCAASGNDNSSIPSCPAGLATVISVAATDENDLKASFSDYGPTIDITAPGTTIFSALAENKYGNMSGTSMACPFVSGVAGMIFGYGKSLGLNFTPAMVKYILKSGADKIDTLNPDYAGKLGAGRLNAYRSLMVAKSLPVVVSSIIIRTEEGKTHDIVVAEHSDCQFNAIAVYSDGSCEDITSKVVWTSKSLRYGYFSDLTAGRFIAGNVPDDREVIISAEYEDETLGYMVNESIITIQNDEGVSPLTIIGPEALDPSASTGYKAIYQDTDGHCMDMTNQTKWELIEGQEYARFNPSIPGCLITDASAAGKLLAIRATWTNPSSQQIFSEIRSGLRVANSQRQVVKLDVKASKTMTLGTAYQLSARLLFADREASVDITAFAKWSSSITSAGCFRDPAGEPGLFVPQNVDVETPVILTAQYSADGQSLFANQFQTSVVPVFKRPIDIMEDPDDDSDCFLLRFFSGSCCNLFGIVVLAGLPLCVSLLTRSE